MTGNQRRRQALRDAITAHLQKCPLAADTAEGVIECWLPKRGFEDAPDLIDDVLRELVKYGVLVARTLPDGNTLYVRAASGS